MEKEIISIDYNGYKISGDIVPVGSSPQVLCMHGAGTSSRKIFDSLRQLMAQSNISSCAFDFVGYGETGGDISQSSLKSRTEQAMAVIEKIDLKKPLIIIAGSMAGYNAIKLTEIYPVSLLVLSVPAVYKKDAYEIPFGDKFRSLIRESRSWEHTDAWEILNAYKGKLLILAAGEDNVIPFEVIQKIYHSAKSATVRKIRTIAHAPHKLFSVHFEKHPEDLKKITDEIVALIK